MAGIGEVKHIVLLLRVEHQGILIAALDGLAQLLDDVACLLLTLLGHTDEIVVSLGELGTKHT